MSGSAIEVNFQEFATAASQLMRGRRLPKRVIDSIPSDTLLSADESGVLVETSALGTLVNGSGPWRWNVSVDSKRLVQVCGALSKLGADGQKITIDVFGRDLIIVFRTTRISVPTL